MTSEKPAIDLLVMDLDNTLIDFFDNWGKAMGKACNRLAESRGITQEALFQSMDDSQVSLYARMGNLPAFIGETKALQPASDEEAKRLNKVDAEICHKYAQERARRTLFSGVMPFLKMAKKKGVKLVVYTDSPKTSALYRMAKAGFDPILIDALYAQKDNSTGGPVPWQSNTIRHAFEKNIKGPVIELDIDDRKPAPDALKKIIKAQGGSLERTLFIGDNVNADGGTAVPAGVKFAYQKQGAQISDDTVALFSRISTRKGYEIGVKAQEKSITPENRPDFVLENGFPEIIRYCDLVPFPAKNQCFMKIKTTFDQNRS